MIRKKIKLLTIFIVSVTLIVIPEVFAQTSSTPNNPTQLPSNLFSNSGFLENIIVAILSGILAFLSGYVLSGIESKRGTTDKKLSYNLSIENGIIQIDKNVRKRVKVFYDSEEIDNLYDIKFYLENKIGRAHV